MVTAAVLATTVYRPPRFLPLRQAAVRPSHADWPAAGTRPQARGGRGPGCSLFRAGFFFFFFQFRAHGAPGPGSSAEVAPGNLWGGGGAEEEKERGWPSIPVPPTHSIIPVSDLD